MLAAGWWAVHTQQESRAGGDPLICDLELVCYKHQIKYINNPITIHVRFRLVRPDPLRHCLNRGFSRIKRFRGLNSTNLQRLRCNRCQLPNYAYALASGFSNCRGLKDYALLIREICVISLIRSTDRIGRAIVIPYRSLIKSPIPSLLTTSHCFYQN